MTVILGSSDLLVKIEAIANLSYESSRLVETKSPKAGKRLILAGTTATTPALEKAIASCRLQTPEAESVTKEHF
ncbi:hypothetical protein [Leptolyngbya sp. FACHB-16]|uniref:hypothetical protein n=1 Tax=unclassified Leptolyngbya TaxID=2650499 RepID=UPI001683D62C|nr:hypothetical protein [Leptolyngbya sp. FACHB-16]MBD2156003.1 hypothetical protein [Leptolyngbya sp. FACHB-16]